MQEPEYVILMDEADYHVYHVLPSTNPEDGRVGIGRFVASFAEYKVAVKFCKTWNGDTNKEGQ